MPLYYTNKSFKRNVYILDIDDEIEYILDMVEHDQVMLKTYLDYIYDDIPSPELEGSEKSSRLKDFLLKLLNRRLKELGLFTDQSNHFFVVKRFNNKLIVGETAAFAAFNKRLIMSDLREEGLIS